MNESYNFNVDRDVKINFLNQKPTNTAKSYSSILKKVDECEVLTGKKVYEMTRQELKDLVAMQFRSPSTNAISNNVSVIRKYIDFCIAENLVATMENKLITFTRSELKQFISTQATKQRYISPEELISYQQKLVNNQDKLLLELPYIGVRGRTVKDGTLEEIINLQINPKDKEFKNNNLKLVKNNGEERYIKISDKTKNMILNTFEDTAYIRNNGLSEGRAYVVNSLGNYVFRTPASTKNDKLNANLINSRFFKFKDWVGNKYLSISSLYISGMITMVKEVLKVQESITKQDLENICEVFDFKNDGVAKIWELKTIIDQYIEDVKYDFK